MELDVWSLMTLSAIISFLGFVLENIWLLFTKGFIDNRNMTFPFLLGYGVMISGVLLIIGTPETITLFGLSKKSRPIRYIAYFLICFILVSIGELILGTFMERVFGFEYWNYTMIPLHITKYTSVPTSIGFALIITVFMGNYIFPLLKEINKIPKKIRKFLSITLSIIMTSDFIVSFRKMYVSQSLNIRWKKQIALKSKYKTKTAD